MENSNDNKEQLTLRDQLVLSLLDGYLNGNGASDIDLLTCLSDPSSDIKKYNIVQLRIRAAYKLADLIRKIRLEAFE